MGVFKWLRRERVTVSVSSEGIPPTDSQNANQPSATVGTIRTEEYKRDLAEFQARRSLGNKEPLPELPDTPEKKKCSRHSLPVSCTDCATAHDNTFQYEKKSATKYKKKAHKRAKSAATDHRIYDAVPNIQFLFQNQVFMPGSPYPTYSEPKHKRNSRKSHRSPDLVQKQINFNEEEEQLSSPTPIFYKNNSLPVDIKYFLEGSKGTEEIDGVLKGSHSKSSEEGSDKCKGFGDTSEDKLWEVMSELKQFDQWADEQLQGQDSSKSDDCKSDTSFYGLPIASASNLDVNADRNRVWSRGTWGVVPVQVKKIANVCLESVSRKLNTEINILRKFRHPNIILLMGLYLVNNNVHIICEQCVDSLFAILHIKGRILSAQTAVSYTLDIASALVFLRMQGYIHTELTSHSVMVTALDTAKLADLGPCVRLPQEKPASPKQYELYSPEPQYVNIQDTRESTTTGESEPLISQRSSETYLASNSVSKKYSTYRDSECYRWQAPELFECDEEGLVHPCGKSDVYSLSLILWESCNAAIPWKTLTYEKLKELYTLWKTGIKLPADGTYPGGLLALLQSGLTLSRTERIDLNTFHSTLASVKSKLDDLEYIIIPARLSKKKSNFSSVAWDTNSPTDTSECLSPLKQNVQHTAIVHKNNSSPDTSEKDQRSDSSPMYESIRKDTYYSRFTSEKCYVSEDEPSDERPNLKYNHLPEREISSACSTPIAKIRARIKDIDTPNALHRSDSTEYCSILSPDNRHFAINEDSGDHSTEKPTAKLSRSFTPKSYKPLHIKVPEFNLDTVKSILKENSGSEKSSYNFDIKNYSLPNTPIARSNKLRKNAWLSGDLSATERSTEKVKELHRTPSKDVIEPKRVQSAPETPMVSNASSLEKDGPHSENYSPKRVSRVETSPGSDCLDRDSVTGLRRVEPPSDFSPETECPRDRTSSWSYKSTATPDRATRAHLEDEVLAGVNVKPLVAIHERWIYEANRKTGRSMSLPEDNRSQVVGVKPASHCVDPLQKSLPQLTVKRGSKNYKTHPVSPATQHSGFHWENFCQAREAVAKSINFGSRDSDRFHTWRKDSDKGTITTEDRSISAHSEPKIDQATDTRSIEEFIRELIRKEFQHLLHEISDDSSTSKNEEVLNKGVANIVENLKNGEQEKKEIKSFSRVKISGNNKPLLQITFTRSGENSLQVLDNCVNVTICDSSGGKDKLNVSMTEDTLTEDVQVHSLKRCQAFNAIQEARSTEDLYIDDDLSTQMQENFGGRVKLIPLHGSLHEILCEREDECCLLKVKQENGCDTIYFRCDNSDTESRDAIDGCSQDTLTQDTVVYKRSISLVEERIQRIFPKEKRAPTPILCRKTQETNTNVRMRPKSEVFTAKIDQETRVMSSSSPSLLVKSDRTDEVEVNLENAMCYQDSSSEECIRCQLENDDFELLEKKIEEDLAQNVSMPNMNSCGCLGKISEENLSEDVEEKE